MIGRSEERARYRARAWAAHKARMQERRHRLAPPPQVQLRKRSACQPQRYVDLVINEQELYADWVEAIIAEQEGRPPRGRIELLSR